MRSAIIAPSTEPVGGRYRLGELLHHGGGARVYRAHDEVLGREVALKVLPGGAAASREARAAAGLSHPNIAAVYDTGITPAGDCYVVLELVPGPTLRDVLLERGALAPGEAMGIAAALADALDAAHRRGVIHCDVKPANVVLAPGRVPKLVDFGIARRTGPSGAPAADSDPRGSAPYVAPEQALGAAVDGRADVYALGATLYEMLTGRPPFRGPTPTAVVAQRLAADPPRPSAVRPGIPRALERVVLTALARDPARRFPTAAAMRDALRRGAEGDRTVLLAFGRRPASGTRSPVARLAGVRFAVLAAALLAGAVLAVLLVLAAADRGGTSAGADGPVPTVAATAPAAPPETPTVAPETSVAPPVDATAPPANALAPPATAGHGRGPAEPRGGKPDKSHGRGH